MSCGCHNSRDKDKCLEMMRKRRENVKKTPNWWIRYETASRGPRNVHICTIAIMHTQDTCTEQVHA